MIEELNGNFALIIFDGEREAIFCARDHFGVFPLFFAHAGTTLLLSPSLSTLARQRIPKEVNRAVVAGWVCGRWVDVGDTFFAAIKRVPPGFMLEQSDDVHRVFRYWDPAVAAGDTGRDPTEAWERFDELLWQAVDRCLDGGRAGIFLSGGVDSATIAAVATEISRARASPEPVALSLRLPHPDCDEGPRQKHLAASLGIAQVMSSYAEAFGSEGMLLSALRTQSASMPSINPWEPAYSFLAQEAKSRGCHVILSGEGGNDWLEVDWLYAADLLRSLDLAGLSFLWRTERAYFSLPSRELARLLFWNSGARPLLQIPLHVLLQRAAPEAVHRWRLRRNSTRIPTWVGPDNAVRSEVVERWLRMKPQPHLGNLYARARRRRLDDPAHTVFKEARFERSGEVGVSLVDPFYDLDLVEFLLELPPEVLSLGSRAKGLAEASLRRRIDNSSVDVLRPVSVEAFLESVLRLEGAGALKELRGTPVLAQLGIVDESFLRSSIEEGRYGSNLDCYHAWAALASEAWLQRHLL